MSSYPPPDNVLIPTFNNTNFSSSDSQNNIQTYDNRYLKKISDDSTAFDLTADKLTASNINISSQKQTYKSVFPTLFSYYDFSDKSNPGYDASGNSRNALSNNLLYFANYQGRQNALYFSQSAGLTVSNIQKIDLTQHVSTFRTKQNVAISFWIRIESNPINTSSIFSMSNTGANNRALDIWITGNQNSINARLRYGSTATWQLSGLLTVGAWNFVSLSMGTVGAYLYINGVNVGNSPSTLGPSLINNADSMLIGGSRDNTGFKWSFGQGFLTDFMIWDQQLDQNFITNLYNGSAYPAKIFILAGQSNMCGRGVLVSGVDDNYSKLYNRVVQYGITNNMNSDGTLKAVQTLTSATNPLDWADIFPGRGSSGTVLNTISLFRTFCENLINSNLLLPQERIILIPMAKGSTGFITGDWSKTDNFFYTALVRAFNSVKSMNTNYSLGGLFWIQGENDSGSAVYYADYLQKFYNDLLIDIPELNNCPFVAGEINGTDQGKMFINTILNSFADNNKKFIVKSSGLPTNTGDTTHFNNTAQREIGLLFANQYINFLSGVDFNSPTYYTNLLGSSITTDNLLVNSSLSLDAPINLVNNNAFIQDLVSNDGLYNINSKWLYKQLTTTTNNYIMKGRYTQTFNDTTTSSNPTFYLNSFNLQTIGSSQLQNITIRSKITINQYSNVSPFYYVSETFDLDINVLKNSIVAGGSPSIAHTIRAYKTDKTNINNSRTRAYISLNNENLPNNISNLAVSIVSYNNSVPIATNMMYSISTVNDITITALNTQTNNLILNSLNTELTRDVPSFISSPPSAVVEYDFDVNTKASVKYSNLATLSLTANTNTILPISTTAKNEFWFTNPTGNIVNFPYIGAYRCTIYAQSVGASNHFLKVGYKLSGFANVKYINTIAETNSGSNPTITNFYLTINSVLTTCEFYILSSQNDTVNDWYLFIEHCNDNVLGLF